MLKDIGEYKQIEQIYFEVWQNPQIEKVDRLNALASVFKIDDMYYTATKIEDVYAEAAVMAQGIQNDDTATSSLSFLQSLLHLKLIHKPKFLDFNLQKYVAKEEPIEDFINSAKMLV